MWDIGLNYWAILSCAFLQGLIGMLWYSKAMLGGAWLALIGKSAEELKRRNPAIAIAGSMLGSLVTAWVMALMVFATGAASPWQGLQVGALIWLGFSAAPSMNRVLFAREPLKLFAINGGFDLAVFIAMAELLTLWQ